MADDRTVVELLSKPTLFLDGGRRYDFPCYATLIAPQPQARNLRTETTSGRRHISTLYPRRGALRLRVTQAPMDLYSMLWREWHREGSGLARGKPFLLMKDREGPLFFAPLEGTTWDAAGGVEKVQYSETLNVLVRDGKFYGAAAFPGKTKLNKLTNGTFAGGLTTGWTAFGTGAWVEAVKDPEWGDGDDYCMEIGGSSSGGGPHGAYAEWDKGSTIDITDYWDISFEARADVETAGNLKVKLTTAPTNNTVQIAEQTLTIGDEWQYYHYSGGNNAPLADTTVRLTFTVDDLPAAKIYVRNVIVTYYASATSATNYGKAPREGFTVADVNSWLAWNPAHGLIGRLLTGDGMEGTISFWMKSFRAQAGLTGGPHTALRWGQLSLGVDQTGWANAPLVAAWVNANGATITAGDSIVSPWVASTPGGNDNWKYCAYTWRQTSGISGVLSAYVWNEGGGALHKDQYNVSTYRFGQLSHAKQAGWLCVGPSEPDAAVNTPFSFAISQLRIDPVAKLEADLQAWYDLGHGHPPLRNVWVVRSAQDQFPVKLNPSTGRWNLDWQLEEVLLDETEFTP